MRGSKLGFGKCPEWENIGWGKWTHKGRASMSWDQESLKWRGWSRLPETWESELFRRYLSQVGFSRKQMLRQSWKCRRVIGEKHVWGRKREEAGLGKGAVSLGLRLDKTRSSGATMDPWRMPTPGRNDVTTLLSLWLRWTLEVLVSSATACSRASVPFLSAAACVCHRVFLRKQFHDPDRDRKKPYYSD